MASLRTIVAYTVPAITALFGLLWFFGRKRPPQDRPPAISSREQSKDTTLKAEIVENHQDVGSSDKSCAQSTNNSSERSEGDVSTKTKPVTQVSIERLEEIVTNERSQIVVSLVKPSKGSELNNEEGYKDDISEKEEKINMGSSLQKFDHGIPVESVIKPTCVGKNESPPELFKNEVSCNENSDVIVDSESDVCGKENRMSGIKEEESYRDSLNLDDYDYKSYSKSDVNSKCETCDENDTNNELNEAFMTSDNFSEIDSKSEVVNETLERTTAGNTSMSASVLGQLETSIVGQPLHESSALVPSLLESSILGQPVLESTELDSTSSAALKDSDNQMDSDSIYVSPSNSSEVKLKNDSTEISEAKMNWAELSKVSCNDTESSKQLNICVSEDVISVSDSESNCSKSDSRHSVKDFSPEPHHKLSGSSFDNGVTSSESNCDSASVDSGKGASIHEVPPSIKGQDVHKAVSTHQTYHCNFPTRECGRLIGKFGKNINFIKDQSGANISLNTNPFTPDFQLCTIEGTKKQIDNALRQISHRFPDVDLSPISLSMPNNSNASAQGPGHPVLMPEIMQVMPEDMQLNLPEGVSVDVVVSSIVDAGHVFLQQHTHPSFPSLERLNQFMMACYTADGIVPQLPRPIEVGVICAAPMLNGWYRAQISCVYEDTDECDIKFVDYGGFSRVQACVLRQIRSDFMTLPFQATECYMANVTPLQDEEYFSPEASATLEMLTQGKLLQAQVVGRTDDGIPYVHIYQISGDNNVIFVNRELVNRGLTRWIEVLS